LLLDGFAQNSRKTAFILNHYAKDSLKAMFRTLPQFQSKIRFFMIVFVQSLLDCFL